MLVGEEFFEVYLVFFEVVFVFGWDFDDIGQGDGVVFYVLIFCL